MESVPQNLCVQQSIRFSNRCHPHTAVTALQDPYCSNRVSYFPLWRTLSQQAFQGTDFSLHPYTSCEPLTVTECFGVLYFYFQFRYGGIHILGLIIHESCLIHPGLLYLGPPHGNRRNALNIILNSELGILIRKRSWLPHWSEDSLLSPFLTEAYI